MSRLVKVGILVVLIVLVFAHHAAVHGGAIYDVQNLFSHEAIVALLTGMLVAIVIWGKDK